MRSKIPSVQKLSLYDKFESRFLPAGTMYGLIDAFYLRVDIMPKYVVEAVKK